MRRSSILSDAFNSLRGNAFNDLSSSTASARQSIAHQLKSRIQISFVTDQGLEEAGIDGGGLFKEFIDSLIKEAFAPETGLFVSTPEHTLIPRAQRTVLTVYSILWCSCNNNFP